MRNVLITGGAGFIGSNFVYYWLDHHPDDHMVVLDALTYAGNKDNLLSLERNLKFTFVHGDIVDQELVERLIRTHDISLIIHFAAESHVDRSIEAPDNFITTNIIGTHSLLKAVKKMWLDQSVSNHHFHHISTDEVYGALDAAAPAFSEKTPYAPNSPYAASKASSDHLVRSYHKTYGLNVTTSNCSNNYGPFQFVEKLIPMIISNICDGKPLPVYGDGKQIRDWLHVEDHCRGIDLVIKNGRYGENYNIGGDNEWVNIDIFNLICDIADRKFSRSGKLKEQFPDAPMTQGDSSKSLISHIKDRPGHDRRYAIDNTKITSELGFHPLESFESGILKTFDWYIENEIWWRNCQRGHA